MAKRIISDAESNAPHCDLSPSVLDEEDTAKLTCDASEAGAFQVCHNSTTTLSFVIIHLAFWMVAACQRSGDSGYTDASIDTLAADLQLAATSEGR